MSVCNLIVPHAAALEHEVAAHGSAGLASTVIMPAIATLLLALQAAPVAPEAGELHLSNVRQLTHGGQNAEAYFSASGRLLILQRQGPEEQCDQMYVMSADGADLRRVSSGRGRTT